MKTKKTVTLIRYCSIDFAKPILDSLVQRGVLSWYCDAHHMPDIDSKKAHGHLTICPVDSIDLDVLQKEFVQVLDDGSQASITNFGTFVQSSKWSSDWFPYMIHDEVYCIKKGLSRNIYNYSMNIFTCSDYDRLQMYADGYDAMTNKMKRILEYVEKHGLSQSVYQGLIPIQQINQYKTFLYGSMSDQEIRQWFKVGSKESENVIQTFLGKKVDNQ